MRKFLFTLITLTAILTFAACTNNETLIPIGFYDIGINIKLSDTNPVIARTTGYVATAQVGSRAYFFREGDQAPHSLLIPQKPLLCS
ncbi:MAG: hypothetical protein FWE21_09520 [Defluviitaleaceae bacterium]|nr:hypothetical protein [Defluviitaleaceae bacterium]